MLSREIVTESISKCLWLPCLANPSGAPETKCTKSLFSLITPIPWPCQYFFKGLSTSVLNPIDSDNSRATELSSILLPPCNGSIVPPSSSPINGIFPEGDVISLNVVTISWVISLKIPLPSPKWWFSTNKLSVTSLWYAVVGSQFLPSTAWLFNSFSSNLSDFNLQDFDLGCQLILSPSTLSPTNSNIRWLLFSLHFVERCEDIHSACSERIWYIFGIRSSSTITSLNQDNDSMIEIALMETSIPSIQDTVLFLGWISQ